MMNFQYRAMNGEGAIMEGVLSAQSRRDAIRKLESMGLDPVKLEQGAASAEPDKQALSFFSRNKKISSADLESFTRQLSSLLAAGVPLSRALNIIQRETPSAAAKEKWGEIHDLVIDGSSLADAMRQSPENFPAVYVAMVQAGETGGFLDIVLGEIAEFQARQRDLKSRTISALIYPLVLMVLALCVLIFLLVFFIPRFKIIFSGFGAQLPLLTRIIVGVSDNIAAYGPILAIIAAVGILLIRKWFRSEQGRRQWQMALLRLPVVGAIMAKFAMTRFCRMLGTLVASGVPLISALSVARESIGNQTLSDAMTSAIARVRQGSSLAASLSDCRALFPGSVIEMISVAEESGRLDKELLRLAQETEHELDRRLRTAVALLEPLMLFVMAGFIGTIFIGMVIPIFTLQDYIK
ncbi:MAG TPA: type II secretion system F family protein [Candidatus Sumerlaeota bacterium]|nr:type II secretion system F family protein [Candidatus Sumerlaeota bacterium]HON49482.1 type II secretion system F family protein [Candidatus Sumerlaeota bacterium]HOR64631.1 type II secretion system F family protein [Candidatus Sumerlaeota bacterium]HPL74355.1 type II secretion system F family protein [Candidatus Sumerlaeota bacterium]HRU54869.1 type II secretion system F family protein [Candidatus Sumerlaeia bacterium]